MKKLIILIIIKFGISLTTFSQSIPYREINDTELSIIEKYTHKADVNSWMIEHTYGVTEIQEKKIKNNKVLWTLNTVIFDDYKKKPPHAWSQYLGYIVFFYNNDLPEPEYDTLSIQKFENDVVRDRLLTRPPIKSRIRPFSLTGRITEPWLDKDGKIIYRENRHQVFVTREIGLTEMNVVFEPNGTYNTYGSLPFGLK